MSIATINPATGETLRTFPAFTPGEIEDRNAARTQELGGLILPDQTIEDLRQLANKAGVDASILH